MLTVLPAEITVAFADRLASHNVPHSPPFIRIAVSLRNVEGVLCRKRA